MSDFLFVKRQGNGELHYCIPQGYEWAIADAQPHTVQRPSPRSSKHHVFKSPTQKQEEKNQKRWSLGPWQRVKLRQPPTNLSSPNRLGNRKCDAKYHANAPFCSIVLNNASPLPAKLKAKPPPMYSRPLDKQKEHTLREKAKIKERFSMVLPVVAPSKNGEWVPQAAGRKIYSRLARHGTGGWSKRFILALDGSDTRRDSTVDLVHDRQHFSLDKPEVNSAALLLHKLHIAEEELKHAQVSIRRALSHMGCDHQGLLSNIKDHHGVLFQHGIHAAEEHHDAPNEWGTDRYFSVRSSCTGARIRKKMYPERHAHKSKV